MYTYDTHAVYKNKILTKITKPEEMDENEWEELASYFCRLLNGTLGIDQ